MTKTVILETDTHCYKTFPLAKPCKGKGSGKGLKDKFSKGGGGKGRALWIDAGPIVGKDGSVTVGSEAAMNSLIKPTKAKAKGDEEENLPQVSDTSRKVYDACALFTASRTYVCGGILRNFPHGQCSSPRLFRLLKSFSRPLPE